VSFSEKLLPLKEDAGIKLHLILCENCSELLAAQLVVDTHGHARGTLPFGLLEVDKQK